MSKRRTMPPIPAHDLAVLTVLEETRSIQDTARALGMPIREVQKVAMMAFGLGHLDVALSDF